MHFFVHHVNMAAPQSPHILDLKKSRVDMLEKIGAASPTDRSDSLYHFYHEKKSEQPIFQEIQPLATPIVQKLFPKKSRQTFLTVKKIFQYFNDFTSAVAAIPTQIKNQVFRLNSSILNFVAHCIPWKKLAFGLSALIIILIAPLQAETYYQNTKLAVGDISANSTAGFMALQDSTTALMHGDIASADRTIGDAVDRFQNAITTMQNQSKILQTLAAVVPVLGDAVKSRQQLLLAGQEIALGNAYLIHGVNESQRSVSSTLTERLTTISTYLKSALPNYEQALLNLNRVKTEALPLAYQQPFVEFKNLFTTLSRDFKNLSGLSDALLEIFGGQGFRRYLLVFQNPAELRPTGGFIGSFAVLDIRDGQIANLEIPPGGPYDLQGQLSENVEPPTPLLLLRPRWEFQDANWFPDFPKSAEKIMRFYRKSRSVTIDGVIAINGSVLEKLLTVIGPIYDAKRGLTLTSDNALATIQQIVESTEQRNTQKPKQIIADLAPQLLDYFKNIQPANLLALLSNLETALTQKEIQAYFVNPTAEEQIKTFGWSGNILPTNSNQDYLMVVNTNIQGQKSDARIKQNISHQAVVDADGTVMDTVIITRTHTGNASESMYGAHNVNYIRLYVPQGSELLEASGFTWPDESKFKTPLPSIKKDSDLASSEIEINIDKQTGTRITNEFGKTAFGNWIITEPGQTTQVQFVYRLPFKLTSQTNLSKNWTNFILANYQKTLGYQLVAQRQSGCDSTIESQIIFPDNFVPDWYAGADIKPAVNGAFIENQPFEQDQIWSVLAKN